MSGLSLYWEAGTRTPIARSRVWSPTIGRPPNDCDIKFTNGPGGCQMPGAGVRMRPVALTFTSPEAALRPRNLLASNGDGAHNARAGPAGAGLYPIPHD